MAAGTIAAVPLSAKTSTRTASEASQRLSPHQIHGVMPLRSHRAGIPVSYICSTVETTNVFSLCGANVGRAAHKGTFLRAIVVYFELENS